GRGRPRPLRAQRVRGCAAGRRGRPGPLPEGPEGGRAAQRAREDLGPRAGRVIIREREGPSPWRFVDARPDRLRPECGRLRPGGGGGLAAEPGRDRRPGEGAAREGEEEG